MLCLFGVSPLADDPASESCAVLLRNDHPETSTKLDNQQSHISLLTETQAVQLRSESASMIRRTFRKTQLAGPIPIRQPPPNCEDRQLIVITPRFSLMRFEHVRPTQQPCIRTDWKIRATGGNRQ